MVLRGDTWEGGKGGIQVEEKAARALANECGQDWTPEWAHQKQEMQLAALPGIREK